MKAYLNDLISSKDTDRSKAKTFKQNIKNRPEINKDAYSSNYPKIKLKSEPTNNGLNSMQKRKNHQRVHTESQQRKYHQKDDSSTLNKTQSKPRLKTQMGTYNSETIKCILDNGQKHLETEENPFWGAVKQKLQNDGKIKKGNNENSTIKKLVQLAKKAKQVRSGSALSTKNPEDSNQVGIKDLHLSMDLQVQILKQQLVRKGDENKQLALCEVISQMISYSKNTQSSFERRETRLLKHVCQIQERNLKLMSLMNRMKQKGIDVDSFWINSDN